MTSAIGRMTDLELLDEIIENLRSSDCTFWACPGPDTKPVHMATCRPHWALHDAKTLRKRLAKRAERNTP